MPGDSKTAGDLMSWGSNVAAAQRLGVEEIHESHWKRAERLKASSTKWNLNPSVPSPGYANDSESLQNECNLAAQRLSDEMNELQYCDQILMDNEREFQSREQDLMQALAEIRHRSEHPATRPVAEEVRIREEALWHLEKTMRRLEGEEDIQGQALVALADCVSCCQIASDRSKALVGDTALFTKMRVLSMLQRLREICVSFSTRSIVEAPPFADDACEIDLSEAIAKTSSDRPLRVVLYEALSRISHRCSDMRNVAAFRVDTLMDCSVAIREECERQSVTVHHAHQAIEELRERSEELIREIEACQLTEQMLRAEVSSRAQRHATLQIHQDSQIELRRAKDKEASALAREMESVVAEEKCIRALISEQLLLKESYLSARQRSESDLSSKQVSLHAATTGGGFSADVVRDISRKISSLEIEVDQLGERIRKVNEDENTVALRVQELHGRLLDVNANMSDIKSCQRILGDEAAHLSRQIADAQAGLEVLRSNASETRVAWESEADLLHSSFTDIGAEEQRDAGLSEVLASLKQQLLHKQEVSRQRVAPTNVQGNSPALPEAQVVVTSNVDFHSKPFVVSTLENVVSTAPLTQLLLAESRAPWRVPLEPRYHRSERSDTVRNGLLNAFQL